MERLQPPSEEQHLTAVLREILDYLETVDTAGTVVIKLFELNSMSKDLDLNKPKNQQIIQTALKTVGYNVTFSQQNRGVYLLITTR